MKWLLLLGGAYVLLRKPQPGPAPAAPEPSFPQPQGQYDETTDQLVDRVKQNVEQISDDVATWWGRIAAQDVSDRGTAMPPAQRPMAVNTAVFS